MRLFAIEVEKLPGLAGPLLLTDLTAGINVVVGPNASGKSSLVRALSAVLYSRLTDAPVSVSLDLVTTSGARLTARRLGPAVEWSLAGELVERPNLPPAELLGAYLVRLEDLVAVGVGGAGADTLDVDDYIGSRLQLELTGGVDLTALRGGVPKQKTAGRKEATALKRAENELVKLRRDQDELRHRLEGLAATREARDLARAEAARRPRVQEARDLHEALRQAQRRRDAIAALPAVLAEMTGEEADAVARLRQELDACRRDEDRHAERLAAADEVLAAAGVPKTLTMAEARRARGRAEELIRLEQAFEQREQDAVAARAAAAAAWRRMGGVPDEGESELEPADVDRVERLVQRQVAARARSAVAHRRLAALAPLEADPEEERRLGALRRLGPDLARWLEVAPSPSVPRVPGWAWLVALGLALASLVLTALVPRPWPVIAGSAAVLLWLAVSYMVLRGRVSPEARTATDALRRSAAVAGRELPEPLTHAAVAALVDENATEIALSERRLAVAEEREREADRLNAAVAEAEAELALVRSELTATRSARGLGVAAADGPSAPDGGFAYWLGAALEHARASVAAADAMTRATDQARRVAGVRDEVLSFLAEAASDRRQRSTGPELLTACEEVLTAVAARDDAMREAADCRRELGRANAARADAERALGRLALRLTGDEETNLDDLALSARRLVDRLPDWREAHSELRDLNASVDYLRGRLANDPELLAAAEAGHVDTIDAVAERVGESEREAERLNKEIIEVEQATRAAEADRRVEASAAMARQARDDLELHLSEALEIRAAHSLLDVVEAEHESAVKPAALERARSWFERFTHGDFELTFERDDRGAWRFGAVDRRAGAGGLRLRLSELSTGTRAQLLLSARLAFALEAEARGDTDGSPVEPLPFFLDEALTTSDQERFFQVANAVLDVAEETGRQFVYLSARQEDADLWRDVAAERGADLKVVTLAAPPAEAAAASRL